MKKYVTLDGNEAVAHVAHQINEVIAIYPITPSSNMGEWADQWSAEGRRNIWGTIPTVVEMQSEGGAAGAVHGALQAGALTTTFTASQGLLLMIPNMYKIAGELTPMVIHVAARSLAAQALSIFGDHSDVMAARSTGYGQLCSASVQEAMDFTLISQAASLASRLPFLHFFDGFRTSHEVSKVELLQTDIIRKMIDDELVFQHRARAMTPDRPVLRGTAQNPDVYFQARETVNQFYDACPQIVVDTMKRFAELTGRTYEAFQYEGAPDAERVIIMMGSGAETAHETVDYLRDNGDPKVGLLKVRLYRPFSTELLLAALPATARSIAVLDRTKEPGASGEPLYTDVVTALREAEDEGRSPFKSRPRVVGGRYGLSSKEFTPAMVKGIFDELAQKTPRNHFTIGIKDDVTHTSLEYPADFSTEPNNVVRALFYGLGSDGTVGANKNSIKIIGEGTDNFAQGYFVYDSKKAGAVTVSHLRFGPKPIRSTYLVSQASFIACHQTHFVERMDMLKNAAQGGTFLLNSPAAPNAVWDTLPREMQEQIVQKQLKIYCIDADTVAREAGMGRRINTVMQVCFFAISGVLPRDEAIGAIKKHIDKTYGAKGKEVVEMNYRAVDSSLEHLHEVKVPAETSSQLRRPPTVPERAPDFVRSITAPIMEGCGDALPVSAMPCDGTYPTATSQWDKRNIALEIPVWDTQWCIQCGKCAFVCPHGCIRFKAVEEAALQGAPSTFKTAAARDKEWKGLMYSLQVAPEDCTGCGICVDICPAKNKKETRKKAINMEPQAPLRDAERENWDFFLKLPELDRTQLKLTTIKQQQAQLPLFEFSSACAGCGETPYIKLATQLFGDRMYVANATGCSSIYGGNLPTTPWCKDAEGRGPTWSNSLFEDNAEFGMGFRLTVDKQQEQAREMLARLASDVGDTLSSAILEAEQTDEADIFEQRERVAELKKKLAGIDKPEAKNLATIADMLVKKSVWIVGGDGWAYDIGFGGLDHVLASGRNVNVLVLDTEVYSNTGGQMSKATPKAAIAKFAAGGKPARKKDLGMIAMSYGNIYVASVAMGARDEHTLKAFLEAEAYDGPSLIIAYSHCIAHGIDMTYGMQHQKAAVESGQWLLYRYNPDREQLGQNPLQLDSRTPKVAVKEYLQSENRFNMLTKAYPEAARDLFDQAQADIGTRWDLYSYLASRKLGKEPSAS